ncbi:MAG: hypothetical protein LC808_30765 [Actinobacteria bacterium]|nr:hypothetical protein [Actinomycetota bacterium]
MVDEDQPVDVIPKQYWQPIVVTCACGREHGGHRIEHWDSWGVGAWTGEFCGTLDVDGPADVDWGTAGPDLSPHDKAGSSRLRRRDGRWPVWRGRCKHCRLDVPIRGDQLHVLLCGLAQRGERHIDLWTIKQAAACHERPIGRSSSS